MAVSEETLEKLYLSFKAMITNVGTHNPSEANILKFKKSLKVFMKNIKTALQEVE